MIKARASHSSLAEEAVLSAPGSILLELFQMLKPRVALLVLMTVLPGLFLGTEGIPSYSVMLGALLGTFLASGSASIFNQLIEADSDARMSRTRERPLPTDRIPSSLALSFAIILAIASMVVFVSLTTWLAAAIALIANAFYVLVYTMVLKRTTPQNIVIGGAAGAVGPLIGAAAATDSLGPAAWLLFALIFFWTPAHFWALALNLKEDYARAGIPMLPVVKGDEYTRKSILFYSLTLFPIIFGLQWVGAISFVTLFLCLWLSGVFAWRAWKLYQSHANIGSMQLFYFSCIYLLIVYVAVAIDRIAHIAI